MLNGEVGPQSASITTHVGKVMLYTTISIITCTIMNESELGVGIA